MSIEVLDPTHESEVSAFEMPARPTSLHGATVGFISNGKEGTKGFFSHLARILEGEYGVAATVWRTKRNYSAPAEAEIVAEAVDWDLVVSGLGD